MNRFAFALLGTIVLGAGLPAVGFAQTSAPPPGQGGTAPVTGIKPDRTTADRPTRQAMRQKQAALKLKRAECRKQAREQRVSLLKRRSFMRTCMSR
jgi:hypothetical protein